MIWHVLDVRAIWIKEFASALGKQAPTLGWFPHISNIGILKDDEWEETLDDPYMQVRYFPLQRGFARFPVTIFARECNRILRRLVKRSDDVAASALICCAPHYADVAALWPGPVVYYVTDLFKAYGDNPRLIKSLDLKMCEAADIICPNSQRIADYLMTQAACPNNKILIVPNATREANLLGEATYNHSVAPKDIADLPRPLAGVIGNMAANMDWQLIIQTVERTPWLSWVFIGPTEMAVSEPRQNEARLALMQRGGHVRFVGYRSYGALRNYARSFDVAILPYKKHEPTYSGSSTRFYEHLATCRPMLATRGVEELLHKEPLLKLVDSAEEMTTELEGLRDNGFQDGYEEMALENEFERNLGRPCFSNAIGACKLI